VVNKDTIEVTVRAFESLDGSELLYIDFDYNELFMSKASGMPVRDRTVISKFVKAYIHVSPTAEKAMEAAKATS